MPNLSKLAPLLEGISDAIKGTKVADVLGKPVEVYHGSSQPIVGPIKAPAFFTTDKSGAEWYAKNRGDSTPTIHKAMLNIKNPLDISNKQGAMKLIDHARDAGVHVNVNDPGNGEPWEFYSKDISQHSPYDGESPQDLLYVPKVRDALQKAGHDGVFLHDTLSNSTIPTWIPLDKNQVHHIGSDAVDDAQNFASGGSVVDRDREQRLQNEHSQQVLKQMARGWLAGTVGMPGDLEGLARHLIPGISNTPFLPTSDFYKEWLPGSSEDPRLQTAADVGSWTGGMGAGPLVKGAASIATKAGLPLVEHTGQLLNAGFHGEGPLSKVMAPAQPMYAVKPKGGNWTNQPGHNPDEFAEFHDIYSHNTTAPNKWRDKQLVNYIKNQMGTTDDPLLKLEQEGRLHMTPQQMEELSVEHGRAPYPAQDGGTQYRIRPNSSKADKFHVEATGRDYRTPWENLSDQSIGRHTPGEDVNYLLDNYEVSNEANTIGKARDELLARNDPGDLAQADELKRYLYLDKIDPQTPLYGMGDPQGLGFQHMMDYMDTANAAGHAFEHHGSLEAMRKAAENAVPNAPIHDFIPLVERNLHLTDDAIGRSSVADIAAKTGEWNKILEQTKTLRAQAQVPDFKTYDSGHVWKAVPDTATSDDGLNFALNAGKDAGWCTQTTGLAQHYGGNGNQLYILHDAAGKPKVQIAVEPPQPNWNDATRSQHHVLQQSYVDNGYPEKEAYAQATKDLTPDLPPAIKEIKGRMNRRPDPEDIPMVQDFVKSGKWGEVRDLQNSGLRKTSDAFNPLEQQKIKEAGGQMGEYHTPEEIDKFNELGYDYVPDTPPAANYAKGGLVHGLINIDTYVHNEPIPPQVMQALVRRFGPHLTMRQVLDTFKKEANGGHPYSTKKKLVDWAMSHK